MEKWNAVAPMHALFGRQNALAGVAAAVGIAVLIPVFRLNNLPWPDAAAAAIMMVLPCVMLGLIAWRAAARAPTAAGPMSRAFALQVACAIAFSVLWTFSSTSFLYFVRPSLVAGFVREGAAWQLAWGLVIYGAIVQVAAARARLKERELAMLDAELQALRAQLNPHFLFNTLHSLGQLAREDPVATQEALERFGNLMRYVLDAGRRPAAEVALEEEVRFVHSYLAIEALRLGDRLRFIEDIDPDALELAVPPLLLQPLVENAIRHGIAPRREGGTIRLTARITDATLTVEVSDDGNGAESEAWRRASGMGLKAVSRQLDACFAGSSHMQITTQPRAGFTALLQMPVRTPARVCT
jgi:hypothetical protein